MDIDILLYRKTYSKSHVEQILKYYFKYYICWDKLFWGIFIYTRLDLKQD